MTDHDPISDSEESTEEHPAKLDSDISLLEDTQECPDCGMVRPFNADCPRCGWEAENSPDNQQSDVDDNGSRADHIGVAVVSSTSRMAAVAKGKAAFKLAGYSQESDSAKNFHLLTEYDDPGLLFPQKWNTLVGVAKTSTESGAAFVSQVQEALEDPCVDGTAAPLVLDERGDPFSDPNAIPSTDSGDSIVEDSTASEHWVVAALISEGNTASSSSSKNGKTTTRLECNDCPGTTEHHFDETVPIGDKSHSIWECVNCGASRYGPSPDENSTDAGEANQAREERAKSQAALDEFETRMQELDELGEFTEY